MSDQPTNEELRVLDALLADGATWAEPRTGLEDEVVRAVSDASAAPRRPRSRARRVLIACGAVAAAVVVVVAVAGTTGRNTDAYDAQLVSTKVAPAAHASAGITRAPTGFHVTLDATGLPALASGEYFEAWLKNAAGVGVPIGTFTSSAERITLWSGVSPASFPIMTVTIETIGAGAVSSDRVVLTGEVHVH
jgi:hypothetical protein